MSRIIECVPNFSEGQQKEVIEAIAKAIGSTPGCSVLDVDPGVSTNRTVYTFVGPPEMIVEGALNGARVAIQLIDMSKQTGEHPRLGAMDVCPFIPVKDVTMEDCVQCAEEMGRRMAEELSVPVYLYGYAAKEDYRRFVPQIRKGEYEGLEEKLSDPAWKPDFGPAHFVPSWGATMVGARKFLIAYNVNMLSTKEQAHRIALNIRENGRSKEEPGRLKHTQAIGWYLEEANMAQVSVNITDYEETGVHQVFEEVVKDAKELNLAVVGSQIVGLVPLEAIIDAAEYYIGRDNLFLLEEDQKIRLVIDKMGLNSLGSFLPKERIIEYMVGDDPVGPLALMDVRDFVMAVGSRTPAPGGGSVSALTASLGAALAAMAGFLTYGNRKFEDLDSQMRRLLPPLYNTAKDLTRAIDDDTSAFNEYMTALKISATSPEEKEMRAAAMTRGLEKAISVPYSVCLRANALWPVITELAHVCNLNCRSDLQVGAKNLETGVWGCYQNIIINLDNFTDEKLKEKYKTQAEEELKNAQQGCAQVLKVISERKS